MKKFFVFAAFATFYAAPINAQVTFSSKAMGVGGIPYMGMARGYEALEFNPANIGLSKNPFWSVTLPQLNVGTTFRGFEFKDLGDIVNFDDISPERSDEILGKIPETGVDFNLDMKASLIAVQNRNFMVGLSYGNDVGQNFSKDIVELIFDGYEPGRTDYSVGNTSGKRTSYYDLSAGYGKRVGPVSLGVTGHYYIGRKLSNNRLFEPVIDVQNEEIEVEFREVSARGGRGFGLDVGAAMEPVENLTLSASVANIASRMKWNEKLYTRSVTLRRADLDQADERIYTRFKNSEEEVDNSSAPLSVLETAEGLYEDAFFPSVLKTGLAYYIPKSGTNLGLGYQNKLSDGNISTRWDKSLGVAIQQNVTRKGGLKVRTGYTTNMDGGSILGGGISLGPLDLGVSKIKLNEVNGFDNKGYVFTFGLNARTSTNIDDK